MNDEVEQTRDFSIELWDVHMVMEGSRRVCHAWNTLVLCGLSGAPVLCDSSSCRTNRNVLSCTLSCLVLDGTPLGELAATAQQAETDQVQTRLALNLRKTVELAVLSVGDDCLGEWGPEWCGNGSVTVLDKTLERVECLVEDLFVVRRLVKRGKGSSRRVVVMRCNGFSAAR